MFGMLALALPETLFSQTEIVPQNNDLPHKDYPYLSRDLVSEVVGVSHFNLERLKALVDPRPELAKVSWEWGFADFESAIGAASHTGRKDIVRYLLSKGASPSIFTLAMLGEYEAVKHMLDAFPGAEQATGPHGISLLEHVEIGLEEPAENSENALRLKTYLEELGTAGPANYLPVDSDTAPFIGDYLYGPEPENGFTVSLNRRKMLALGRRGNFGGALYKIDENTYIYNGSPSVKVRFQWSDNKIVSLTVEEPGLTVTAKKI